MGKVRKLFGYHTGQEFIGGVKEYELKDGDPDEEFLKNPDHFIDPIYVVEAKPVLTILKKVRSYISLKQCDGTTVSVQGKQIDFLHASDCVRCELSSLIKESGLL